MEWIRTKKKERISTTVSRDLAKQARKNGIKFSYALSLGIRQLLKQPSLRDYTDNADMIKKIGRLSTLLGVYAAKLEKLETGGKQDGS